ncbi:PREDICTED: lysine-specific demethylase JMJ25-like [Erythranthe guttata]|uniref:lysine-specific demethylase JMJ25-like n=1 Tax=Erythranthe guttata TaxID=4155 RepID=UPI00064E081D|nr:PREDICTED: lysine-specific demethylase JMJ25-like [Erythranthe guttata]|eukprot:XP_012857074.1 PREDICTED: lysine-specific demethylase JMJ25-like [Erythranthe guttata]
MLCSGNCKSSVFDIHRNCPNCSYKLCVRCCQEIRNGFVSYSKVTNNGNIICPPQGMGSCGPRILELKSTYPVNWISELLTKAESVADAHEPSEGACSCSGYNRGSESDNFRCPTIEGVETADQKHFQWHLYKGQPVIVPNVLSRTTGLSWEPLVMWRAFRKIKSTHDLRILEFSVTNCLNWCEETINIHQFFKGYTEGFWDSEGRPKILKLEDWPPAESFAERLPRHFQEFVKCLPFKHYTHQAGYLNMTAKTPKKSLKPELGPKICFGYGVDEHLGFCSASKLQYGLSDMVNILMHTAAQDPVVSSASNEKANEKVMRNQQSERENKNKGKEKIDSSTSANNEQRFDDQRGGAVWDVFRRQDVPKLEEYLRRHYGQFRHIFPLQQLFHPIHEKAFYLTVEHKRNLNAQYGIKPWTFIQKLGDAVIVPAGCPYQIRNLKSCTSVSANFVSPESVGECIRVSTEYRRLPHNHSSKEDKLQVKTMVLYAVCQAVQYLERIDLPLRLVNADTLDELVWRGWIRHNLSRIAALTLLMKENSDEAAQSEGEIRIPSLAEVKRELERMKLILETKGHLIDPHIKAYLLQETLRLLNKVNTAAESSTSQ